MIYLHLLAIDRYWSSITQSSVYIVETLVKQLKLPMVKQTWNSTTVA